MTPLWVGLLLVIVVVALAAQGVAMLLLARRLVPRPPATDTTLAQGATARAQVVPADLQPSLGGLVALDLEEARTRALDISGT